MSSTSGWRNVGFLQTAGTAAQSAPLRYNRTGHRLGTILRYTAVAWPTKYGGIFGLVGHADSLAGTVKFNMGISLTGRRSLPRDAPRQVVVRPHLVVPRPRDLLGADRTDESELAVRADAGAPLTSDWRPRIAAASPFLPFQRICMAIRA
jgi:hypothetical protein